ncbi:helix-turn-helix domain-containing protein [Actinoplanes sp. CA-051413]|uniref:helix-turn-helix domain-containing protein n=1 Tax=Actinoplanes sp. CA-051413 TaxID=3239899 RepID=UPI003D951EB0
MFRPDDEDKPFIARWNMLARIILVETSVKMVARAAMDYADFEDGSSCYPSNERIARETGYNERTVRTAWAAMRGMGMAVRVSHGSAYARMADEYQLQIPNHWESLPVLGPHGRKFTCIGCGKVFNPKGNCAVLKGDDIRYNVAELSFCAPPRAKKGRDEANCLTEWNIREVKKGEKRFHDRGQRGVGLLPGGSVRRLVTAGSEIRYRK